MVRSGRTRWAAGRAFRLDEQSGHGFCKSLAESRPHLIDLPGTRLQGREPFSHSLGGDRDLIIGRMGPAEVPGQTALRIGSQKQFLRQAQLVGA